MAKSASYMARNRAGGSAKFEYSAKEKEIFDDLRNRKREKLVIYSDNGTIIHTETGTKRHTGYTSNDDYQTEGMNAVHNHPPGTAPYPSGTDMNTFVKGGYKSATIVSKEYTVTVTKDERYKRKGSGYGDIGWEYESGNIGNKHELKPWNEEQKRGMTASEYNSKKRDNQFNRLLEAGRRTGYKVVITDQNGKQTINKPFD